MKPPNHPHSIQAKLQNGVRADLARAYRRRHAVRTRVPQTDDSTTRRPRALARVNTEIAALARLHHELRHYDLTGRS